MPKDMTRLDANPVAPSLALLGIEPLRAAFEYAQMRLADLDGHPPGDGHPVVIFPGLATDARFTGPLLEHLVRLGYRAYDWGRGFNRGPSGEVEAWIDELAEDVQRHVSRHRAPASLVGWSLGGIYAREIAKRVPSAVRRVITIGSPFGASPGDTNVSWLYRLVSGQDVAIDAALAAKLRTPPPVPTTSIYSRSDGVVPWQGCREQGCAHAENVEVEGSHMGLVWNRDVMRIVADRLAQPAPPLACPRPRRDRASHASRAERRRPAAGRRR